MIRKAVLLARGLGKRMRMSDVNARLSQKQAEIASQGIKALMPIIGEKTLLNFIFESLSEAGFSDFCLVIGDEHQAIRDFCDKLSYRVSFAIQEKPLGTANAVLAVETFAEGESFLVVNSDNLYPVKALRELRRLSGAGLIAFSKQRLLTESNISEEKINKFAVIQLDELNHLTKIVEKPETTQAQALISMNAWVFSPIIFEAALQIGPSSRGEYELADAVNLAISTFGEKFKAIYSNEGVLDLSSRADIEKVREKITGNA